MSASASSEVIDQGGSVRHVGNDLSHWDALHRPWGTLRTETNEALRGLPAFTKRLLPVKGKVFEIQYTSATDRRHVSTADYHSGYDVYLGQGAPIAELLLPLGRDLGGMVKVFDLSISSDAGLEPEQYRDYHARLAAVCNDVAKAESTLRGDDAIVLDFRDDYRGGQTEDLRADQLVAEWGELANRMPRTIGAIPSASSDWQVGIYRRMAGAEYKYVLVVKFYSMSSFKSITQAASRQAVPGAGASKSNLDELTKEFMKAEGMASEQCDRVANRFLARINQVMGERYAAIRLSENAVEQPTNTMRPITKVSNGYTHVLHVGTSPTAASGPASRRLAESALYRVPVMLGKAQGVAMVEYSGRDIRWPRTVPQNAPRLPDARKHSAEDGNFGAYINGHLGLAHWVGARCPTTIQPTAGGSASEWDDIYGRQTKGSSAVVTSTVFAPLGQIGAASTILHLTYDQQLKRIGIRSNRFAQKDWYGPEWTTGPILSGGSTESIREALREARAAEGKVRCEGIYHKKAVSDLVFAVVGKFIDAQEGSIVAKYANELVVDGVNEGFEMSSVFDPIAYSTQHYSRYARQKRAIIAPPEVMIEMRDDLIFADLALGPIEMDELRMHFDASPPSPLPRALHDAVRYNYM